MAFDTFRFPIGDFSCLAINDGRSAAPADILFANAPESELHQALERHQEQAAQLPSPWTCLLIDTGRQIVLIDTGEGNMLNAGGGQLVPAMQAEGYQPEQVDHVVLTHGHVDHIGGCLDQQDRPRFPNARFVMWHSELAYWTSEELLTAMPQWMSDPARRVFPRLEDRIDVVTTESELAPGIKIVPAPGHTVGHIAVEITSNGARLLNIADAALHPIHVERPEWVSMMDQDPLKTTATRKALFDRAAAGNSLVLAYHFWPFPSLGHIVRAAGAWRWETSLDAAS